METNFYAILPFKNKDKQKFEELINKIVQSFKSTTEYNLHEVAQEIEDLSKKIKHLVENKKIHLGKRSYGWVFLWDANNLKYYEPTLASIKKFIDDNNAKIVDEYGVEFTWYEFINKEIGKSLHPSKAITTFDELKQLDICNAAIGLINYKYLLRDLPYYQFCTSKTYYEMNPNEQKLNNSYHTYNKQLIKYAKDDKIDSHYSDFITKYDGGLRFSLFTDFS
jgi:hypothetical protein